jgi:hypothetical protein
MSGRARRVLDWFAYWSQWLLLSLFGPAQQDSASDPIEQLKRKYGRPSSL